MKAKRQGQVAEQSQAASYPRRIRSDELFAGAPEVIIEHDGSEYRLRITSQGKLLLMK